MSKYLRVQSRGGLALAVVVGLPLWLGAAAIWWSDLSLVLHGEQAIEIRSFRYAPALLFLVPATLVAGAIVAVPSLYQRYRRKAEENLAKGMSGADHAKALGLGTLGIIVIIALGLYVDDLVEEHLHARGFYRCVQTNHSFRNPKWLWVHRDSWWLCYDERAKRGRYDTPSPADGA